MTGLRAQAPAALRMAARLGIADPPSDVVSAGLAPPPSYVVSGAGRGRLLGLEPPVFDDLLPAFEPPAESLFHIPLYCKRLANRPLEPSVVEKGPGLRDSHVLAALTQMPKKTVIEFRAAHDRLREERTRIVLGFDGTQIVRENVAAIDHLVHDHQSTAGKMNMLVRERPEDRPGTVVDR